MTDVRLVSDWDTPPDPDNPHRGHFVGREHEVNALVSDVLRRSCGSILVSGPRGVGKTAIVHRAIQLVRAASMESTVVYLNASQLVPELAAARESSEKSHSVERVVITALIRRLYAAVYPFMDVKADRSTAQEPLQVLYTKAVARTFESRIANESESGKAEKKDVTSKMTWMMRPDLKLLVGGAVAYLGGTMLAALKPGVSSTIASIAMLFAGLIGVTYWHEKTSVMTTEGKELLKASDLYVMDADIGNLEADLEQVLEGLGRDHSVVFVIDELDKLLAPDGQDHAGYALAVVRGFKNLFTLSRAAFIFIAADDVHVHVAAGRKSRSIDGTLFAHRVFVRRPSYSALERFLDEVIEGRQGADLDDFKNYLCYEARNDFSFLYDAIRDRINTFDSDFRPMVDVSLRPADLQAARAQKTLGLIFGNYEYTRPSDWDQNEPLLDALYAALEQLVGQPKGFLVDEPTTIETEWRAVSDLLSALERYGGLDRVGETEDPSDPTHRRVRYSWTRALGPVPQSLDVRTTIESEFRAAWKALGTLARVLAEAFTGITGTQIDKTESARFTLFSEQSGLDATNAREVAQRILRTQQQEGPRSVSRTELTDATEAMNDVLNAGTAAAYELFVNALRLDLPNITLGRVPQNTAFLHGTEELRSLILDAELQHAVVYRGDLLRQILVLNNPAPELLTRMSRALRRRNATVRVVAVRGSLAGYERQPRDSSKGLYVISLEEVKYYRQTGRRLRDWLQS